MKLPHFHRHTGSNDTAGHIKDTVLDAAHIAILALSVMLIVFIS